MKKTYTLGEFIIDKQSQLPYSTGELFRLLSTIKLAKKVVHREVNKAGLADIIGSTGITNIQGEAQQKLDHFSYHGFIDALTQRDVACDAASEEDEDFIPIEYKQSTHQKKYVVLINSLDGSSDIDMNISIDTIFSIYTRTSRLNIRLTLEDFFQPGSRQVTVGYILYDSFIMMVVHTTGNDVNDFTLDPSLGTFYLSNRDIQLPEKGTIYSINEGNYAHFPHGVKDFIKYCQKKRDRRRYPARYVGSLVADFHRNLIKGGICIYPGNCQAPQEKLRLFRKCNPIAFSLSRLTGKLLTVTLASWRSDSEHCINTSPFSSDGRKWSPRLKLSLYLSKQKGNKQNRYVDPKESALSIMSDKQSLKRKERLKVKLCIEKIFEKGLSLSVDFIRIVYVISSAQSTAENKVGVSVSKRFFKRAVDRNRIKRLLRTSYRLNKNILKKSEDKSYQIMFIYTGKTLTSFDKMTATVKKTLYCLIDKTCDQKVS